MSEPVPRDVAPVTTATHAASPFHPGEQAVQIRAGVRDKAESLGHRMLTPTLTDAQHAFFAGLSFVVAACLDENGQPRAALITGVPGFIQVLPDGRVRIERADCVAFGARLFDISPGSRIGLLGIEFARRRRNRINGTLTEVTADGVIVQIDQSYGNCPKHITKRAWDAQLFAGDWVAQHSDRLSHAVAALVDHADTFFIASSSGPAQASENIQARAWGADISHRGGAPGFLARDGNVLSFDDYPGNNLFNTLGNLEQYPPCSLILPDFQTGEIVQIAGHARLSRHDGDQDENRRGYFRVAVTVAEVRHWQKQERS